MFDFKLEKVLDYRENIEKKSKEEFSQILAIYNREKEELEKLNFKKQIIQNKEYTKNLKTANDLRIYQRYLMYIEKSIEEKIHDLENAEKELEKSRLNLIKSTKDKKIIEILKENAFEDYLSEENRIEQKNLDDIALRGYIETMKGGEK